LKDRDRAFNIEWKLIDRGTPYNPVTRKCRLCLKEKFTIIYKRENATINKRSELFSSCRHRWKTLLSKVK